MLQPGPVPAQLFSPPSREARFLLRNLPGLTSPPANRPGLLARIVLAFVVAPMTQFTFISFDLQAFLFLVFHRKWPALLGHGVFMTLENLMILAALHQLAPHAPIDPALGYAALLVSWCAVVARQERLWLWAALMVPLVAGLYVLAAPVAVALTTHGIAPWHAILASAFFIALSHAPEAKLPPRAGDPMRWMSIAEFVGAPGLTPVERLGRALRIPQNVLTGTVDELWAAPRLMTYNYLFVLMWLGYRPELAKRLHGWADAAWADGQPALDYVGTGGGTFLAREAK